MEIKITLYDLNISFERVTIWADDTNYGADSDGHRGCAMSFVDEDYAEDITVLGVPLEHYPEPMRMLIENEVNWWIEENDPDRD